MSELRRLAPPPDAPSPDGASIEASCEPSPPQVHFGPETGACTRCGAQLHVQKTHTRTVVTLAYGEFVAHETVLECAASPCPCPTVGSPTLARLVKPGYRYGYDLVVHAGLARHLHAKKREELCAELRHVGIHPGAGTISDWCDRFLVYLEALHVHRAPALRAAMAAGYPLHLDATCDQGKGGLFVCLDGVRGWVLAAARIATEREELLAPVIEKTVARFGDPLCTMRDLGEAGAKAVAPLRERGILDLVCHYHFLRAVGIKLFDKLYKELRTILLQSGVAADLKALLRKLRRGQDAAPGTQDGPFGCGSVRDGLPALVQWVLEGTGTKDLAYPFGLPHLGCVLRARELPHVAERFLPCPRTQAEWVGLGQLTFLASKLDHEPFVRLVHELQAPWQAFCEFRDVLRLTNAELPGAPGGARQLELPALELARLHEIEKAFLAYEKHLTATPSSAAATIRTYIERYRDHLFGHPAVRAKTGAVLAVVSRVNNALEQLFGQAKQLLRERVGRAHLGRDLEQQPAQAAYVRNLRDPLYVHLLCGSLERLPEAFADLDARNLVPPTSSLRDHRRATLRRIARSIMDPPGATAPRSLPGHVHSQRMPTVL